MPVRRLPITNAVPGHLRFVWFVLIHANAWFHPGQFAARHPSRMAAAAPDQAGPHQPM
jgi:hypothetical protein